MTADKEAFLSRWSRLKRDEAAKPEEVAPSAPASTPDAEAEAPPLPPVEGLTPESDFTPFMHAKVPAETRTAALKKLFADPQFNIPDLNEAYSGDWTGGDPIPLEMLKTLHQAQKILFDKDPDAPVPTDEKPAAAEEAAIAVDHSEPDAVDRADNTTDAKSDTMAVAEPKETHVAAGKDA